MKALRLCPSYRVTLVSEPAIERRGKRLKLASIHPVARDPERNASPDNESGRFHESPHSRCERGLCCLRRTRFRAIESSRAHGNAPACNELSKHRDRAELPVHQSSATTAASRCQFRTTNGQRTRSSAPPDVDER
jgi:hypothetical protein